jgi:hypothetical protein
VKGEFVGGCDIITEMFQNGELKDSVRRKRHRSVASQRDGLSLPLREGEVTGAV